MKQLVAIAFVLAFAGATPAGAADKVAGVSAADLDDADIVILAVKPRSPDVRPVAMSVGPAGQTVAPETAQAKQSEAATPLDRTASAR